MTESATPTSPPAAPVRAAIDRKIAAIEPDGGTEILPALAVGLDAIRNAEADARRRVEVDSELVRAVEIGAPARPGVEVDHPEVDRPDEVRGIVGAELGRAAAAAGQVVNLALRIVQERVVGDDLPGEPGIGAQLSLEAAGRTGIVVAGIDVVLMDSQRSPKVEAAKSHAVLDAVLADVAKTTGADLFSRAALMDEWARAGLSLADFVAPDRLHHNDRGYTCVARALAASIATSLRRQEPLSASR